MKNKLGYILIIILAIAIIIGIKSKLKNKLQEPGLSVIEYRFCSENEIDIRTGPGINYSLDSSGTLVEGEKIYVFKDTLGWLKFRVTENDIGWHGWVKKDHTITEEQWENEKLTDDINKLTESGLLTKINPQLNEAFVNSVFWSSLNINIKENIGRSLAFYCGNMKGTDLNWVEIKDSKSGKKLAKYSENWGFKIYE